MTYEVFKIQEYDQGKIIKVIINRPQRMNAMNQIFFTQLYQIFQNFNKNDQVKVVILVGEGKVFSSGLDLKQFGNLFTFQGDETARTSIKIYQTVKIMQKQFLSLIECRVPVLVGIHKHCVGGGIDLISMADIRYCTLDSQFSIKEVDIGMAADLGTLQIFPNIIGNQSVYRQLAFTGRFMKAPQAQKIGFVSKIFESKQIMEQELLNTARIISEKSPVAIYTMKQIMKRQMYKKIWDSLDYMARTNSAMLFTKDTVQAITSFIQKKKPQFPKL